jgi:cytochrome c oxidase subunit 2
LRIHVTGVQWWWRVFYPEEQVTTANEIHIPTNRPVELLLDTNDVIHSFWVPRLHGKVDMIPGKTNTLVLQADTPGEYVGECAEFCGTQHARMHLRVIAQSPEEFDAWLQAQSQPAPSPPEGILREGQQIFLGSACVYCHAIRGTNASGVIGPDLTHLASRRTLAAGTVPNTRGYLMGWIADPHGIKPGNRMPPTYLDADDLDALVTYLESLE